MLELREGRRCYPMTLVGVNVGLACVDGVIAFLAFYQGSENEYQGPAILMVYSLVSALVKGFNLVIVNSSLQSQAHYEFCRVDQNSFKKLTAWMEPSKGYFLYFVLTPVAACKGWICWSYSCGFIVMGREMDATASFPQILFVAAFLLLLSFWIDLCHQASDDDEDDEICSPQEALLEKINITSSNANVRQRCCSFKLHRIGSRQKIVILVYVDLISIIALLLGGALACYGIILFLKMSKVRADRTSWERSKVASLAIVCLVSFTSSASIAIGTNIPLFYSWHGKQIDGYTALFLVLYYFIGSSVPSAFILFVMRELPHGTVATRV
ncbi:hypothetical protein STAS_19553 [Striga asiatica]|uniref:THH1/TOM1/TOM3 domain-containing protein n=1 Tax=Striga asiatica TaxID=4170 RepID=A0A5A7QBV9_STRAF|nr:hypothetical protein STAS_19553 [Striga asiatica]